MGEVPIRFIELDSDEDEGKILVSGRHVEHPSTSQSCEVSSSSSSVRAKSQDVHEPQKGINSTSTLSSKSPIETARLYGKKNSNSANGGKTPYRKKFVRILPKPTPHEKINEVKIISDKSSSDVGSMKKHSTQEQPQTLKSQKKFFLLSPMPTDPKNPISKIVLLQSKSPVGNSTSFEAIQQKVPTLVSSGASNQQHVQLQHKLPGENNSNSNRILVRKGRTEKKIIRQQRVYLTESREPINKDNDRKSIEIKDKLITKNNSVTDEQDPLYIPGMQAKMPSSSIIEEARGPLTSINKLKSPKSSKNISIRNSSQALPNQITTKHRDVDILTPIVTLTEPTNSEHSIVRNYALLNKVTTKKNENRVRSKSVPPPKAPRKESTKTLDTDLIYRNKLMTSSVNSDSCRNFFIKNSAWDYLEPVFKGFNEREQNISQSCSNYCSKLMNCQIKEEEKQAEESFLTNDDLFYTRKIEVLDKEGKLESVYYVPQEEKVQNKRKQKPTYTLPPTKKCKVVLERNQYVEHRLKIQMMNEKLNSFLTDHLNFSNAQASKPLIILNRVNYNILKVNESLCQHANIIYVKNLEDQFPERLCKNDFIVSQIENKTIRLVTPAALKYYFM